MIPALGSPFISSSYLELSAVNLFYFHFKSPQVPFFFLIKVNEIVFVFTRYLHCYGSIYPANLGIEKSRFCLL